MREEELLTNVEVDIEIEINVETIQTSEAEINVANQATDAGEKVVEQIQVGLDQDIGVDDQAVQLGSGVEQHLEVSLEAGDDLENVAKLDVGLGLEDVCGFIVSIHR